MKKIIMATSIISICSMSVSSMPKAIAADLDAMDFVSAPSGTLVNVNYFTWAGADNYHGAGDTYNNARLSVLSYAFRLVYFTDICGVMCTPQIVIPYVYTGIRSPGSDDRLYGHGIGDPQVGGTMYIINDPKARRYSGLLTMITVPAGDYSSNTPASSPGAHRWAGNFVYNFTQGVGDKWLLETNLDYTFYGKNHDYDKSDMKQKPVFKINYFSTYEFTPATYATLRLTYSTGGAMRLDGTPIANTHEKFAQVGFTVGHWIDHHNRIGLHVDKNIYSHNSFDQTVAQVVYVHAF